MSKEWSFPFPGPFGNCKHIRTWLVGLLLQGQLSTLFSYFHFYDFLETLSTRIRALCEMCPNTEFFLVLIFPHLDWIRRDTRYLSVFSPNAGKYGPEKTSYLDTFHAVHFKRIFWEKNNRNDLTQMYCS